MCYFLKDVVLLRRVSIIRSKGTALLQSYRRTDMIFWQWPLIFRPDCFSSKPTASILPHRPSNIGEANHWFLFIYYQSFLFFFVSFIPTTYYVFAIWILLKDIYYIISRIILDFFSDPRKYKEIISYQLPCTVFSDVESILEWNNDVKPLPPFVMLYWSKRTPTCYIVTT